MVAFHWKMYGIAKVDPPLPFWLLEIPSPFKLLNLGVCYSVWHSVMVMQMLY